MKTMMTLLALACLPHTAHTAESRRMEHKPLPGQPLYPHDQLTEMAQPQVPGQQSVRKIAQQFGGKGTLRRPNKPAHLIQPTQQHPQPSAPLPPAYHSEWLPLSPQSPQSAPSDRSPSACSNESHSSALERTTSYKADEPSYVHHFLHEPAHGWTSHSSQETHPSAPAVRPSAPPLEDTISYIQGEEGLLPEVKIILDNARQELKARAALQALLERKVITATKNCISAISATPQPDKKRGEATSQGYERTLDRLTKERTRSAKALIALNHAMHKSNKDVTEAADKIVELKDDRHIVHKNFKTK